MLPRKLRSTLSTLKLVVLLTASALLAAVRVGVWTKPDRVVRMRGYERAIIDHGSSTVFFLLALVAMPDLEGWWRLVSFLVGWLVIAAAHRTVRTLIRFQIDLHGGDVFADTPAGRDKPWPRG